MLIVQYSFEVHLVQTERKIYYINADSAKKACDLARERISEPDKIIITPAWTSKEDLQFEVYGTIQNGRLPKKEHGTMFELKE